MKTTRRAVTAGLATLVAAHANVEAQRLRKI